MPEDSKSQKETAQPPPQAGEPPAAPQPTQPPAAQPAPEAAAAFVPLRKARRGRRYILCARYGKMLTSGDFSSPFARGLRPGVPCVVKTPRGTEFAFALTAPREVQQSEEAPADGRVIRLAVEEDVRRYGYIQYRLEPEELAVCRQRAREQGLPMRVVAADHVLGGEKIVFYFLAEQRVDFRALLRALAEEFHTRIELRQVGVRDEARLLGDTGHCGLPLCCRSFIRHLEPVGMKEAKVQKITDPTKMSGHCGRLMCCLRYEVETYQQLLAEMPRCGVRLEHQGKQYTVADQDPIGSRLILTDAEGGRAIVPLAEIALPPDVCSGAPEDEPAENPEAAETGPPDSRVED